jgi:hypothetical protein
MRESLHGHAEAIDEEVDLVGLGSVPIVRRFAQHQIQQHEFSGDERRSGVAPVAIVILLDRLEELTCIEMIDVAALLAVSETAGEVPRDESVEEVAHVLAVLPTGERGILPAQAVATVQGDGDDESGLLRGEAGSGTEWDDVLDPLVEGHRSYSRWCGSVGVPPGLLAPAPRGPAAR